MLNDRVSWRWAVLGLLTAAPAYAQLPGTPVPDIRTLLAQNAAGQTAGRQTPGAQIQTEQTLSGQTPGGQTPTQERPGGQTPAGEIQARQASGARSAQPQTGSPARHDPDTRAAATQGAAAGLCRAGGNGEATHKVPARLTAEVNATFGSRMTSTEIVASTVYRCIGSQVMVCAVGANLNCGKADQSRTPGPGVVTWCRSHPNAGFVPLFASGHATVYDWSCRGSAPQIGRQLRAVDAQGFVTENWKPLGER